MSNYNSRNADKFVVRLPEGMRSRVTEQSDQAHISMNSWIVQAIEEKLNRALRQELLLDALESATTSYLRKGKGFTSHEVRELRNLTGHGLIDCHRAMKATEGNIAEAAEWLKSYGNISSPLDQGEAIDDTMQEGN